VVGPAHFDSYRSFTGESTAEVRFKLGEEMWAHLGDSATEVEGDGSVVDDGEALVDAEVTEVAIEKTETYGNPVVDGVKLRQTQGGQGFETQGVAFGLLGCRVGRGWEDICCKEAWEIFGWDGASVEPALAELAAQPEEHVGVGLVFDSFGYGEEIEAVAEADDGGGDLAGLLCVGHGADEAGVDFKLVEGQGLEVTKAGVARAEVVEGKAGTLFFELVGDEIDVFGVVYEGALGDLEDETVEGEVCLLRSKTDVPGEGAVGELGERDVDGEGEVLGDGSGCGEDGTEEIRGEEAGEAGLFGERDEVVGEDKAAMGMVPAGEDLETTEPACAQLYERLEEGYDLAVLNCSA
jgi:hypothetical protein